MSDPPWHTLGPAVIVPIGNGLTVKTAVDVGTALQLLVEVRLPNETTLLPTDRAIAGIEIVEPLVTPVNETVLPFTDRMPLKGGLPEIVLKVTAEA